MYTTDIRLGPDELPDLLLAAHEQRVWLDVRRTMRVLCAPLVDLLSAVVCDLPDAGYVAVPGLFHDLAAGDIRSARRLGAAGAAAVVALQPAERTTTPVRDAAGFSVADPAVVLRCVADTDSRLADCSVAVREGHMAIVAGIDGDPVWPIGAIGAERAWDIDQAARILAGADSGPTLVPAPDAVVVAILDAADCRRPLTVAELLELSGPRARVIGAEWWHGLRRCVGVLLANGAAQAGGPVSADATTWDRAFDQLTLAQRRLPALVPLRDLRYDGALVGRLAEYPSIEVKALAAGPGDDRVVVRQIADWQ
jgi:hypothetical protein